MRFYSWPDAENDVSEYSDFPLVQIGENAVYITRTKYHSEYIRPPHIAFNADETYSAYGDFKVDLKHLKDIDLDEM